MLNKILANTLPHLPKKLVWVFSKRYVAGENIDDVINISLQLNGKMMLVTVDLLGEFIHTLEEAERNCTEYLKIVDRFTSEGINGNFSLKPTSFGLLIDTEKCYQLVRKVVAEVANTGNFVRIDMEDSQCTSSEIKLFQKLREEFPENVGLVVQAYLFRTYSDLNLMIGEAQSKGSLLNIRLCKGIYVESESIAYHDFNAVRFNFMKCLELLLKQGAYVGIATHDTYLVNEATNLIEKYQVPKNKYEFQMLYGVTPSLRDRIVADGHTMRIYVPFGKEWFGYCSRRLKENPKIVSDIIKAVFIHG